MGKPRHRSCWQRGILMAAALASAAPAGHAASRLEITAQRITGAGIAAREVALGVTPAGDAELAVLLRAARVDGLDPLGRLVAIRMECRHIALSAAQIACAAGRISGDLGAFGRQDSPFSVVLAGDQRQRLAMPRLSLAGGRASLTVELHARQWRAGADFSAVDLGRLAALPQLRDFLPGDMTASGEAGGSLQATGAGAAAVTVRLQTAIGRMSFANEPGTLAGENVALEIDVSLRRLAAPGGWSVEARLDPGAGQAYFDPFFVDFDKHPVELDLQGRLAGDASTLALERFRFRQQGVGLLQGSAQLGLNEGITLQQAQLQLQDVDLAGAWPVYGSPLLIGTQFSDLQALGRVRGRIGIDAGLPSRIELDCDGVTLDSVTGSLGVQGLSGRLNWFDARSRDELAPRSDSAIFKSSLSWQAARLWGIEFGAASLPFTTTGDGFRLLEPVLLPVFDGGLAVETLRIRHAGAPNMYLSFDAELRPVSIGLITRALGWPEFSGTLAGRIPRLELEEGLVTFGGNIEAEVFDGRVTIRNLRMRDPLGQYPQLFGDIDVEALDLQLLTRTFEFGMITGRLSGRVASLETFDWMPVAFDASFFTTPGDRSPHRISQRAVSNLSSIGGGSGGSVTAALQGGLLRFFDTFRYDRLGLSCRLANDVCEMDGVAPARGGYYIVKGAGLPRIDVIGSQRRVAWSRLLRQLTSIASSGGAVVK